MNIINQTDQIIDEEEIIKYLNYLKLELKVTKELSLVFETNEAMQILNKQYRNKDYVTDVLTFVENKEKYLGDVIICYNKIKEQSQSYNHSWERELYFLITHGFLHLLGYDHQTKEESEEMFSLQEELLNKYGIRR